MPWVLCCGCPFELLGYPEQVLWVLSSVGFKTEIYITDYNSRRGGFDNTAFGHCKIDIYLTRLGLKKIIS
jgi:hypothetical protein